MRLFTIDPSTKALAWASWEDRKLHRCGYFAFDSLYMAKSFVSARATFSRVVIEDPQIYIGHKNTKGADAEDLIQLAKVVGACAAASTVVEFVKPNQWKGQLPKNVMWARTVKKLDDDEVVAYTAGLACVRPSLHHNVHDAIGLGLYYLGRLDRN